MTRKIKGALDVARFLGETTGILEGLLQYNLPEDVKEKLKVKIKELRETEINIPFNLKST